jgi:RNA-binding protein PNO1
MTPLKKEWVNVYGPLVEMMGLQVRMNVKRRCVELKVG